MAERRTGDTQNTESKKEPSIAGTIVVSNVSHETSENDIFIYFQKRKNQGGEVLGVSVKPESQEALVYFEDDEVAKAVVNSKNHVIKGNFIDVELYEKYIDRVRRTVLVSKLPSNINGSFVKQHFDKRSSGRGEIENVKIIEKGEALVVFKNPEDAKNLIDTRQLKIEGKEVLFAKPESFELEPKKVQKQGDMITAGREERTIVVSEFPEGTTQNIIHIHFQRKKNKGGEVEGVIFSPEKKKAFVIFEDPKVAQQVVNSEQKIKGETVNVKLLKGETKPPERKVEPEERQPPLVEPGTMKEIDKVFSAVTATINPALLNTVPPLIFWTNVLNEIRDSYGVRWEMSSQSSGQINLTGTLTQVTSAGEILALKCEEQYRKLQSSNQQAENLMHGDINISQNVNSGNANSISGFDIDPSGIKKHPLGTANSIGCDEHTRENVNEQRANSQFIEQDANYSLQASTNGRRQAFGNQPIAHPANAARSPNSTVLERRGQARVVEEDPRNNNDTFLSADSQVGTTANAIPEVKGKPSRMDSKLPKGNKKSDDSMKPEKPLEKDKIRDPTNDAENSFTPTNILTSCFDDKRSMIKGKVDNQTTATPNNEIKPEGEKFSRPSHDARASRDNQTTDALSNKPESLAGKEQCSPDFSTNQCRGSEHQDSNINRKPASAKSSLLREDRKWDDTPLSTPASLKAGTQTEKPTRLPSLPTSTINDPSDSPPPGSRDNASDDDKPTGYEQHDARASRDNQTTDALCDKPESRVGIEKCSPDSPTKQSRNSEHQDSNINRKPASAKSSLPGEEIKGDVTPLSTLSGLKAGTQSEKPASQPTSTINDPSDSPLPDSENNASDDDKPTGYEQHDARASRDNQTTDALSSKPESLAGKEQCSQDSPTNQCSSSEHQDSNINRKPASAKSSLLREDRKGDDTPCIVPFSHTPLSTPASPKTGTQSEKPTKLPTSTDSLPPDSGDNAMHDDKPTGYEQHVARASRDNQTTDALSNKPESRAGIEQCSPDSPNNQSSGSESQDSNINRRKPASAKSSLPREEVKGEDTPLSTPSGLKAGTQIEKPASQPISTINDPSDSPPPDSENNAIDHEPTGNQQHDTKTNPTKKKKCVNSSGDNQTVLLNTDCSPASRKSSLSGQKSEGSNTSPDPASNSAEGNIQTQPDERQATLDQNSNQRPSSPETVNTETSDTTSASKHEMKPVSTTETNQDSDRPKTKTPTPPPRQKPSNLVCGANFTSTSRDTQLKKDRPTPTVRKSKSETGNAIIVSEENKKNDNGAPHDQGINATDETACMGKRLANKEEDKTTDEIFV